MHRYGKMPQCTATAKCLSTLEHEARGREHLRVSRRSTSCLPILSSTFESIRGLPSLTQLGATRISTSTLVGARRCFYSRQRMNADVSGLCLRLYLEHHFSRLLRFTSDENFESGHKSDMLPSAVRVASGILQPRNRVGKAAARRPWSSRAPDETALSDSRQLFSNSSSASTGPASRTKGRVERRTWLRGGPALTAAPAGRGRRGRSQRTVAQKRKGQMIAADCQDNDEYVVAQV